MKKQAILLILFLLLNVTFLLARPNQQSTINNQQKANKVLNTDFINLKSAGDNYISFSPTEVEKGEYFTVTLRITNSGNKSSGSFNLHVYLSSNTTITTSDTKVGVAAVGSITPGEIKMITLSCYVPPTISSGDYYVGFYIDPENYIKESDEYDNAFCKSYPRLKVKDKTTNDSKINLIPGSLSYISLSDNSVAPGDSLYAYIKVENEGTESSGSFKVAAYLSSDTSLSSSDIKIGDTTSYSISGGYGSYISIKCTIPDNTNYGNYHIIFKIDVENDVTEYNEDDNIVCKNDLILNIVNMPSIEWEKSFGGSSYDYANSVKETSDGGYIIAGYTNSYGVGGYDVYLIKTDDNGNKQWQKTFGGSSNDYGRDVIQTSDGGYIIVGYTYSYGTGRIDIYLIKTDDNGNKQWQKTFGTAYDDKAFSICKTNDGGYLIAGGSNYNTYLIKIDSYGNKIWEKILDLSNGYDDKAESIKQTSDGGYVITGYTYIPSKGDDIYLTKIDSYGNKEWIKTFGGSYNDYGKDVIQTADGGYIVTGSLHNGSCGDVYLIKTDANGNKEWDKIFINDNNNYGYSVIQTSDYGYLIATSSGDGVYLIKTDKDGNEEWERKKSGFNAHSVIQSSDGGYVVAGDYYDYAYLIKFKGSGTQPTAKPNLLSAGDNYISFYPSSVNKGDNFNAKLRIINNGEANAGTFKVYAYLSTDANITSYDTKVGEASLSGLSSGYGYNLSITCTVPSSMSAGSYYLGFIIDPTNSVAESNENDNTCYKTSQKLTVKSNGGNYDNCVVLTMDNVETSAGKIVNVPIKLDNKTYNSTAVAGIQFTINYEDKNKTFTINSLELGNRAKNKNFIVSTTKAGDSLKVLLYNTTGSVITSDTGEILEIPVEVSGNAQEEDTLKLNFTDAIISDAYGNSVNVCLDSDDPDAMVTLGGCTTCDANKDGQLNILDIVKIVNCALGKDECDGCSDKNGDGKVDILDVIGCINVITNQNSMAKINNTKNNTNVTDDNELSIIGDNVSDNVVYVYLKLHNNIEIAGIQLNLKYDRSKVELKNPIVVDRAKNFTTAYANLERGTKVLIYSIGHTIPPGEGYILKFNTDFIDEACNDSIKIEIDSLIIADKDGNPVEVKATDGFIIRKTTDIEESNQLANGNIKVYPNPTTGMINIEVGSKIKGNGTILLYNLLGEEVYKKNVKISHKITLNPEIGAGVYILKLKGDDNKEYTTKVTILK